MLKPIFITISIFLSLLLNAQFEPVTLYKTGGGTLEGYAKIPELTSRIVLFKKILTKKPVKIESSRLDSMHYNIDDSKVIYHRQFIPLALGNKKLRKTKSWLKVKIEGPVTLYYGFDKNFNAPNMNLWYTHRKGEAGVYFIYVKYSGGLAMTIGAKPAFRKNAAIYFKDYPELVNKIKSSYTHDDLERVVEEYNEWNISL